MNPTENPRVGVGPPSADRSNSAPVTIQVSEFKG